MTLGERLDNSIADSLVAFGVGLRRAWILSATVADRLLGGRPKVCDTSGLLADLAAADQLADAEAEREVWEPGGVNDQIMEINRMKAASGYQPDLLWAAENRRQEFTISDGPAYVMGRDFHLCKTWDGECRCPDDTPGVKARLDNGVRVIAHTSNPAGAGVPLPGIGGAQNPRSRAHSPEPVDAVDAPGSVPLPGAELGATQIDTQQKSGVDVESVLLAHRLHEGWNGVIYCHCDGRALGSALVWWKHINPLVMAAVHGGTK